MKAVSECGFEHPSEGSWCLHHVHLRSTEPMHSQSSFERRYPLPSEIGYGKDVRVCDFCSAKH